MAVEANVAQQKSVLIVKKMVKHNVFSAWQMRQSACHPDYLTLAEAKKHEGESHLQHGLYLIK